MNQRSITYACSILAIFCGLPSALHGDEHATLELLQRTKPAASAPTPKAPPTKELIREVLLSYDNEDITSIINYLAALKEINVLFPQPPAKLSVKVSLHKKEKVPLDEAWTILGTLLDIAGWSFVEKDCTYVITENNTTATDALSTYINTPIEALPDNDTRIRYLYSFTNITLYSSGTGALDGSGSRANIESILRDMLSPNKNYIIDPNSNSLIIVDKASNIRSVMRLITTLDQTGFRESAEVIQLAHAQARTVADLITKLITSDDNRSSYGFSQQQQQPSGIANYFAEGTKVVPIERLNALAIIGKIESINNVKRFIDKYLDKPFESGRSVIHVKPLQWLSATDLEQPLTNLIAGQTDMMQATSRPSDDEFKQVIIVAEKQQNINQNQQGDGQPTGSSPISGGNNLIIAARDREWKIIEKLIDELDQPQLQVAIEGLIVDLKVDDTRMLAAQSRNRAGATPHDLKWQSALISGNSPDSPGAGAWLNYTTTDGQNGGTSTINSVRGLAADLLSGPSGQNNLAQLVSGGTTVLTFKDGTHGISNILEILEGYSNLSVLSQPFVITANHIQAEITNAESRLVQGAVEEQSSGGNPIIKKTRVNANITIKVTPRISRLNNINMEVVVTQKSFKNDTGDNNTILNRSVKTNANICEGDVLVLGGLTQMSSSATQFQTPILSRIPILGTFFKNKKQRRSRSNLTVFIAPTVIRPQRPSDEALMNAFTKHKAAYTKDLLGEENKNFEELRDPVTRLFFRPAQTEEQLQETNSFLTGEIFKKNPVNQASAPRSPATDCTSLCARRGSNLPASRETPVRQQQGRR